MLQALRSCIREKVWGSELIVGFGCVRVLMLLTHGVRDRATSQVLCKLLGGSAPLKGKTLNRASLARPNARICNSPPKPYNS